MADQFDAPVENAPSRTKAFLSAVGDECRFVNKSRFNRGGAIQRAEYDIVVLVTQNGGSAGVAKSSAATWTYDIYDAVLDPTKATKLNQSGVLSLTGNGNGWRGLKIPLTAATYGRAYLDNTNTWKLYWVDEKPSGEQDCS